MLPGIKAREGFESTVFDIADVDRSSHPWNNIINLSLRLILFISPHTSLIVFSDESLRRRRGREGAEVVTVSGETKAPEFLTRKGYDAAKADVWSCGVILFVLMAGHIPFYDKNIMVMYKKIYKGEFRCPRWFSSDLVRLLTRLLDTNPNTRITIPEIMKNRWFKKGFKHVKFYIEDDKLCREDEEEDEEASSSGRSSTVSESDAEFDVKRMGIGSMPRPASLNAFDIISFSSGFDLSGLFEEEGGEGTRFVSGAPVSKIISKLEEIAKVVSFTVRKKEWSLRLEGCREGAKGPLTIAAEIFELTSSLVVVEVKKKGGDREEYEEFYNKELRPELEKLIHEEVVVEEALYLPSDTE